MRRIFFAPIALLALTPAWAEAAQAWLHEKTVHFAPEARLTVSIQEVAADEKNWDWLQFSLSYDYEDMKAEAARLKREHPGYEVNKTPLRPRGNYRLRIPSLDLEIETSTMPGLEGPYFNADVFVSREQSPKVRAALRELESFVELKGELTATVPVEKVVERAELPTTICEELLRNGSSLYDLVTAYPAVENQIEQTNGSKEIRASLRRQILRSCVSLPVGIRIRTFTELLNLSVKSARPAGSFTAEVRRTEREAKAIPLEFRTVLER